MVCAPLKTLPGRKFRTKFSKISKENILNSEEWPNLEKIFLNAMAQAFPLLIQLQERICFWQFVQNWRKIKGATGIGTTGLRGSEGNLPPRGSLRGSLRGGSWEVFRGFQGFLEVFQSPSQRPSQSAIFLSELLLIVLPLKTPTTKASWDPRSPPIYPNPIFSLRAPRCAICLRSKIAIEWRFFSAFK